MTTNPEIDKKLDDIALKQLTWKNQKMLTACLMIAEKAIARNVFWPDELIFDFLLSDEDRNLIGSAWRLCSKTIAIIEKTGSWRRSKVENRNGGNIFEYRLVNRSVAMAFLRRYDVKKHEELSHPQLDLFK